MNYYGKAIVLVVVAGNYIQLTGIVFRLSCLGGLIEVVIGYTTPYKSRLERFATSGRCRWQYQVPP